MRRRGIQIGQIATDEDAAKLDRQCKVLSSIVLSRIKAKHGDNIRLVKKLNKNHIPGGIGACSPDGSLWFWNDTLIAAFEGKKQQNRGNAIERWFKNNFICRSINPDISYVTFACGGGAFEGGVIHKTLAVAHRGGFNTYVPGGNTCWMKKEGFTDEEIEQLMFETVDERITSLSE